MNEVDTLTAAYTQTLQYGIAGIALLIVVAMIVGLVVAFVMARGFNQMISNAGRNEDSSNAAITQMAVALTSGAQQQQTQTQLGQRQVDLLTELPAKLATLINQPIADIRSQMLDLIGRFEDMEKRDDDRLTKIETTIKTSLESAKLKPNDFKPIIDMLEEWRTIEQQDHAKINTQLMRLIELHTPPPGTEPDDQQPPAPAKQPLDLDAAKADATVAGDDAQDKADAA